MLRNAILMNATFLRLALCTTLSAMVWAFSGCNSDHARYVSPDGKNAVWVFTRNGGATTSYSRQVSIGRTKPGWVGNIYVQERNEEVGIRWVSNTELEITVDARAKALNSKDKYGKINITYRNR